ncbi:beta-fructofuranosidase-like protein [Trypanosoma theileri]|uniref:Beta-fructofuranosidase-like protein n=1 Tax=Trypanosoma theileri TaxID=67003 RepID=A0A1X0PA11_9TRYP|nr:beta-fructofuranosidase-like protein [Trypanosoma theileri]ORC93774.1 beta-fructofuranosidase-like protein [Trypanosoma theileri]
MLVADLHYDLLFGRPGGYGVCNQGQQSMTTPGCDSPLTLIQSVMEDISKWKGKFTLFTGGLLRHGAETTTTHEIQLMMNEVIDVLSMTAQVNATAGDEDGLSSTQLALGETDFIPSGTFTPDGKQPFYERLLDKMLSSGLLTSTEYSRMLSCGFYYRDLSGTKLRVISLNTILWSTSLRPSLGVGDVDPCGQFPFLESAIEQATQRGRNVIILGDTPPVLNVADALRRKSVKDAAYYWREDFREAYFRIIAAYRFTVAAQIFGHTNTFGFVASNTVGPPLYIIPSVSPLRGSNPSYMRATLDPITGRVVAMRQRYLHENGTWVDGENLEDAITVPLRGLGEHSQKDHMSIVNDAAQWERLAKLRLGGRFLTDRETCDMWCRRLIVCSSLYYDKDDIAHCASLDLPSQKVGLILAIVFTGFGVSSIILAFAYIFSHYSIVFEPPLVLETSKGRHGLFASHSTEGVFR